MATITINGQKVKVDDSFLSMSPEQQDATVDEIAGQLGAAPVVSQQPESDQSQALRSELSAMTQNPAKALYDQRPGWQKPIVAAGDIADIGMDSATFGFGNMAAAGMRAPFTDKSYSEELAAMRAGTNAARDRAGSAGLATDIGASLAVPMAAANRGASLAGRFGTGAMKGATGLGARAGLMGVEGAGYGALSAAGHGEDIGTGAALGAAGGAAGSVAGDAISAGLTGVSKAIRGPAKVPSLDKLKDAAKAAYTKADDAGVIIKPEGMQRLSSEIKADLADFGYHPQLQPRVAVVLDQLDQAGQGNITLKGVDVIRRIADNARQSVDPSERALGVKIINKIDDFVGGIKPSDVMAGDALKGGAALKEARGLWSRVSKNERFLEAVNKADLRAASTGSGGNVENATRQNVRRLLEKGRGFTGDEKAAMEEIIRGTPGQNVLRLVGKLSPSGNGLMAALGIGGTMANPMVGAAVLGGMGAKMAADRGVQKGVEALDMLIRSGGDAAALKAAQGTLAQLSQSQRQTIARLFMGAGLAAGTRHEN